MKKVFLFLSILFIGFVSQAIPDTPAYNVTVHLTKQAAETPNPVGFLSSLGLVTLIIIGVIFFIIMTALVENEQGTIATIVILAIGALIYFLGGKGVFKDFLSFVSERTGTFIGIVSGYLVSGVIYSFIKWYFYVKNQKAKQRAMPDASDHTTTLIRWVAYWPFSIWWTFLNEPIKKLVEQLGTTYNGIAKKVYEG